MRARSIHRWRRCVALAALAAPFAWSHPALAADEYVTEGAQSQCHPEDAVFKSSGTEARLDLYEGTTQVEAWGFGMDFANGISDNSTRLTATIAAKHSGPDNDDRFSCPTQGSIDIKLVSPGNLSAAERADVTVRFPTGTWRLPVSIHPVVIDTVRWDANATLAACLTRNGGSLTVESEGRVVLRVPALLPRRTCPETLRIIGTVVPNQYIDARPDVDFAWRVSNAGTGGAGGSLTAAPSGSARTALAAPDDFVVRKDINEIPAGTAATETIHTVSFNGVNRKIMRVRTEVLAPRGGTPNLVPVATGAPFRSTRTADGRFPLDASFCAGVAAGQRQNVGMPVIRWGARLAAGGAPGTSFAVRLINADSGAVIETLTVSNLTTNLPEQAQSNYAARFTGASAIPSTILVENAGGQCLLRTDTTTPGFRFEPRFRVEVDAPNSQILETNETDNNRNF